MKVSGFAKVSFGFFFALFLLLLLAGVWANSEMAQPVFAKLTWGHLLFLMLHVLAVLAAWIHIKRGAGDSQA